jgi:hypothetical protein
LAHTRLAGQSTARHVNIWHGNVWHGAPSGGALMPTAHFMWMP